MPPQKQITFYTLAVSPHAQRVHIALEEAHAKYTAYEVPMPNKPQWFATVSSFGKVPAITFGGPEVPPDQPSPESAKLVESLALLEFVAEVFPEAKLLPDDPVQRARARAFISVYQTYVSDAFQQAFFFAQPAEPLFDALDKLQSALPPAGTGDFAAGARFSIADAAVAPFLARMFLFMREGMGRYRSAEEKRKIDETLGRSERFARLRAYLLALRARPSFVRTWGGDELQAKLGKSIPLLQKVDE
ncbi:thioredoxin-like protein [Trametes polyzona]|nr:thioredoxin-like protein [Trametes polyzona]